MPSKNGSNRKRKGPTPLELTQTGLDVSVTERAEFRSCRRRWALSTIRNLVPKRPELALDFGTGMHSALEAVYLGLGDEGELMFDRGQRALTKWHKDAIRKLDRDEEPPEVHDELDTIAELGHGMLVNYERFDAVARVQLGDVIAVEGQPLGEPLDWHNPDGYDELTTPVLSDSGRMLVPIVDPDTKGILSPRKPDGSELVPGDTAYVPRLSARIDLLALRTTPHKGLWIVDHKTSASPWNDRGLDFDDQVTGYCYVVWRWTGIIPRGVILNILIKQEPKPPRILAKGDLSTAKDQLTTPDMYRAALRDHGLLLPGSGRIATDKHEACMKALLERGWDPFFQRLEVTRNIYELMSFEQRLWDEYMDMSEALIGDAPLYPNPSSMLCPRCPVNRICLAMEDGSDPDDVIENQYRQGEDRKA